MEFFRDQCLGFFATATENKWIAAFQTHNDFSFLGLGDDRGRDFFLRHGHVVATRNKFRRRRREPEQFGIGERVIHDDFSALEQFRTTQREQTGVAGTGADEINNAFGLHAHILAKL